MREEYEQRDGYVVATLTFRTRTLIADAVSFAHDRLGSDGLAWHRVGGSVDSRHRPHVIRLCIPLVSTVPASPPLVGDGARGLDSTEIAGHLGDDCTDAEADRAMLRTILERLEICWREASGPLLTDVGHAITLARDADTLSRSGLTHLYRTTESLLRRLTHPSTTNNFPLVNEAHS